MFTAAQIAAIIMLLQAFGVDQTTIAKVQLDLHVPVVVQSDPVAVQDPIPVPPPVSQNQPPVFGSIQAPIHCDTTPVISITFNQDSINIEDNPSGYLYQTTNIVDGCGRLYPYNIVQGTTPRKSGLNTLGTTTIDVAGSNIAYWEIVNHPEGNAPYPVTVSTATDSKTEYIQVQ